MSFFTRQWWARIGPKSEADQKFDDPKAPEHAPQSPAQHYQLFIVAAVLLLIAAARIISLSNLPMNNDEVWSIWQTFGSLQDVIRWTPADWPPLYFVGIWVWKDIVGITPTALRLSSVLISLLGASSFYRLACKLFGKRSALLVTLAYGALGFDVFLSVLLRGYIVIFALTPVAVWLTMRYFERPNIRRAIALAIALDAMFLTHYTSAFVFLLTGLMTIILYRRQIWRWWLPLLFGIPVWVLEIAQHWYQFSNRQNYNSSVELPPALQAFQNVFSIFIGSPFLLWVALFLLALIIFLVQRRFTRVFWGLFIWMISLVVVYLLQHRLGLFQDPRYLWWVIPGFLLFIGWQLSKLPAIGRGLVAVSLVVGMFTPAVASTEQSRLYHSSVTLDTSLRELQKEIQPDDAVLLDVNNLCGPKEAWDYFERIYFPNGLRFITASQVGNYRRIWYVAAGWLADAQVSRDIVQNHVASEFFGPAECLFRLYEGAPDQTGILFDNGLRFHGVDVTGIPIPAGKIFHAGDTLHLRLWWSIDHPIPLDYSIGVYVITPQGLGQVNGPPQVAGEPSQISRWQTGRYYVEDRDLTLPYPLGDGTYTITLAVYQWWDGKRIAAPGVDSATLLPLLPILVHSFS